MCVRGDTPAGGTYVANATAPTSDARARTTTSTLPDAGRAALRARYNATAASTAVTVCLVDQTARQ